MCILINNYRKNQRNYVPKKVLKANDHFETTKEAHIFSSKLDSEEEITEKSKFPLSKTRTHDARTAKDRVRRAKRCGSL